MCMQSKGYSSLNKQASRKWCNVNSLCIHMYMYTYLSHTIHNLNLDFNWQNAKQLELHVLAWFIYNFVIVASSPSHPGRDGIVSLTTCSYSLALGSGHELKQIVRFWSTPHKCIVDTSS